jgi:hypothetical protein
MGMSIEDPQEQLENLKENLLNNLIKLKLRIIRKYDLLLYYSSLSNVRLFLEQLIMQEKVDIELLKNAETTYMSKQEIKKIKKNDYEALDHLIQTDYGDIDANNLKDILQWAVKTCDDLHNILEISAHDYEDEDIRNMLISLSMNELKKKNNLVRIYDDLINQNFW